MHDELQMNTTSQGVKNCPFVTFTPKVSSHSGGDATGYGNSDSIQD